MSSWLCKVHSYHRNKLRYSGYFSGGKIFMVERRTTKFLPTKQYRIVLGVWFSIQRPRECFRELATNSLLMKILPPEKSCYMVSHPKTLYICTLYVQAQVINSPCY